MICVVEFNTTATCMMVVQNKYTHVMASFACMTDMVPQMYSKISLKPLLILKERDFISQIYLPITKHPYQFANLCYNDKS